MRKLKVFNAVSLDGYFVDAHGDMSWAHHDDPEWLTFTAENASGGSVLVLGRVTYDLMAKYWPTAAALKADPVVAERMNALPKVVFSKTLNYASWSNTKLVKSDPAAAIRKLKAESGPNMVILGSGTIVALLTQAGLIDEYQLVLNPIVLGQGRTMFDGVKDKRPMRLTHSRAFGNGNVVLTYVPIG